MHILIVEDNPSDADLTRRKINDSFPGSKTDIAPDFENACKFLDKDTKYDIALLDMNLPDGNGMDLLLKIRKSKAELPVIMLTASGDEEVAAAALKAGADDYMAKHSEYYNQLPEVITSAIKNHKESKRKESEIIQVLYIEHHTADIDLTRRHIERYAPFIKLEVINSANKGIQLLDPAAGSAGRYHVVMIDYNLPEITALDFIKILRQQLKNPVPLIIVTGMGNEELAVLALKMGANEYITKHAKYLYRLPSLISSVHKQHELIIAKEKAEESDRLKTAFLHNISHEIRTPMNAINGFSELLNNESLSVDKKRQYTDVIIKSSNQLLSIITDIINIASIEAGQYKIDPVRTNVNRLCRLTHDQLSAKAGNKKIKLNITTPLPDDSVEIVTDETKLLQVIVNIADNAIKFSGQGQVDFGYKIKDGFIEFFVRDTGIGIPGNMHDKIFERFTQIEHSKSELPTGSGLGLSIAKFNIEVLGGRIWLTSEAGKGSVFYFTIPYNKAATSIKDTQDKPVTIHDRDEDIPKTIMIAEDEDFNYLLLEEYLSDLDLTIIRACNGSEAVELCKSGKKIDLILMDIKMPVMGGIEATSKIREIAPEVPIIAQSAYNSEADKARVMECGCNYFLSKPFSEKVLKEKIASYIRLP